MRSKLILRCASAVYFTALFCAAPSPSPQGGEPQYFAIRGARVVPVSGPPLANANIVISRGLFTAIGKDIPVPPEAWVIDGKGLTVYPGLFDSFTDVGIPATPPLTGEGDPRPSSHSPPAPQHPPHPPPLPT